MINNVLKYFYNIDISELTNKNDNLIFNIGNSKYIFSRLNRSKEELMEIYNITIVLLNHNIPCHEIVFNQNGELITYVDQIPYVLLKSNINSNDIITYNDVIMFAIKTSNIWQEKYIKRNNWKELWINKIDNLNYKIKFQKENNNIYYFNYLEGVVENCIQYINEINIENNNVLSICHKRVTIDTTYEEFYNPLNFIIDYNCRDVAEYLKSKLFKNINIEYEIKYWIELPKRMIYEVELFFVRLLFPSYQLDIFEKERIVSNINLNKKYEIEIKKYMN